MKVQIKKATRQGLYLKMALMGPTGSGKTYSALAIASGLGSNVCVLDTERGSASLYSDKFDFSVVDDMPDYHPHNYVDVIKAVVAAGCDVLVIDSLSHAWSGKGGILEIVDDLSANSKSKNAYTAGWPTGTRLQNELLDTILTSPIHVIVTMRSKMDYVLQDDGHGKKAPVKVGLAPVQRDGVEYEFTIIGDLNLNHSMAITKTRLVDLDGKIIKLPGAEFGQYLKDWLGTAPAPKPVETAPAPTPKPTPTPAQPVEYPAPEIDPELENLHKAVSNKLKSMHAANIAGYGNLDRVREDVKAALGVDKVQQCMDPEALAGFLTSLHAAASSDTPFEPVEIPEAAPAPASNPEMSAEVAEALASYREEAAIRRIPKSTLSSKDKMVMEYVEKGSAAGIEAMRNTLMAYPAKKSAPSEIVIKIQQEISEVITKLIENEIDNFHVSKRMSASVFEHLGVKKVSDCNDEERLMGFLAHLEAKLEEAA